MRQRILQMSLGLVLFGLSACTNEGVNPIVGAVADRVNPLDGGKEEGAGAGPPPVTRVAVDRADVAMIRARLESDRSPTYLQAAARNGPYVTYVSSLRQSITLVGSQVTGTRGLGFDLMSSTSSQPDPVSQPIPLSNWPAVLTRSYEFPGEGPQGPIETFTCRFERGEARDIVILEDVHRGIEVSEYCDGVTGSFENLHFADASTGRVWRSLQWTGPRQGLIDLEVVLPYTGNQN